MPRCPPRSRPSSSPARSTGRGPYPRPRLGFRESPTAAWLRSPMAWTGRGAESRSRAAWRPRADDGGHARGGPPRSRTPPDASSVPCLLAAPTYSTLQSREFLLRSQGAAVAMGASHLFVWRRRRTCACQGRGFELVVPKQGLLQMTAAVLEGDAQDIHARAPGEEEGEEEGACLLDACTVHVSRYTTFAYLIDLTVSPMHSVILYDYSLTVSPALTNTIACSNLYGSCLFNTDKYHCLFKDSTILDKCINPV